MSGSSRLDISGFDLAVIPDSLAQLTNLQHLDLRNTRISAIPDSLGELANLEELYLSGNQIMVIPEWLGKLVNLRVLHLDGNQIQTIPESLSCLASLEDLYLGRNEISVIPESVGRLANLRELGVSNNQIWAIPESLSGLANLQKLELRGNRISAIPESLGELANLEELNLSDNWIRAIPESVGRLANLRELDLSDNRITAIPESLGGLANLRKLELRGNQVSALPESLGELANLRKVELRSNQISSLPESFGELANLEELYLSGNQITALPDSLGGLANLRKLDLQGNRVSTLPDSLGELANLEYIELGANQITAFPGSLCKLARLRSLYVYANQIKALPECLDGLASLQLLDVRNNKITACPESLGRLANLVVLHLNRNQIAALPESLSRLINLKTLTIDQNPIPEELLVAAKRGVQSLFRYLKSTAARRVRPRTVKCVLLGEPKSGKTTLLEALKGNPQPCDPSREETIGVDVVTIRKPNPMDEQPMYLSVWDFAGQHIEHATHQFFLTENAIYLVLWNARQGIESGKRDLWYWLELLKMRVREPKFLLIATHTEHTPPDLNLADIERSYSGCQGHFSVELEKLTGFDLLQTKILELAAGSPSLRAEWPAAWLPVRDEIRSIRWRQPYVTPEELRRMMRDKGITAEEPQRDLASQLHDLGEILYFQERDELSSLVILNPEWVTELIGLVVRSKEVREQQGILLKTHLQKLWETSVFRDDVRSHLVHLMDWFDLTYSTGHPTDVGIVVEALPYSTPDGLSKNSLASGRPQMEMIFRFPSLQRRLPPGIPTWGIARAHRFSKCKPWRDAAFFEDLETNSQALILASDSAKEIRLRVVADYPPFFFGRLEAILRDTFKRYPGAEPERRLPCTCQPGCSHSYLFETVVKRAQDRKTFVTCDRSGEDVSIPSLLTGFPRPDSAEGVRAFDSEIRRRFTEQLRSQRERMEKTCPSVFTLMPSRDFKQLDTWVESFSQQDELELALYCEHESGWHPTSHSLYRFRADQEWFGILKKQWNKFVGVTKHVGPLTKTIGKASGVLWAEIVGLGSEKLPEVSPTVAGALSTGLGETMRPELIDLETRHLLENLIEHLDSKRPAAEPKQGGLHPYLVDDGRLLWLCPEHLKLYKSRA